MNQVDLDEIDCATHDVHEQCCIETNDEPSETIFLVQFSQYEAGMRVRELTEEECSC